MPGCRCRDTAVLCSSLTYVQSPPHVLEGEEIQQYTSIYSPPFDEFEVYKVDLPGGASTLLPANQVQPAHVRVKCQKPTVLATVCCPPCYDFENLEL